MPQHDSPPQDEGAVRRDASPVEGRRTLVGVLVWAFLTFGGLWLAWSWPDATLLHFWLVAQAVPVLYWLLMAWVIRSPSRGGDHVA